MTGAAVLPDWADNGTEYIAPGTSIFDPVLCEIVYRWFTGPGMSILDPFAGGSVRGIVAAKVGRRYNGVDLSAAQIAANEAQAKTILTKAERGRVHWDRGDSRTDMPTAPTGDGYDLIFTCPPYYDLEVYSDDPADLSTAPTYLDFLDAYRAILAEAVTRLADNRFAVIVVSEVRGKTPGAYVGLVPDTIRAMIDAGSTYYNEAILINAVGSLPLRAGRAFVSSRKLGRTHQNVLVFVKGDPAAAAAACGPVEVPDADDGAPQAP